MIQSSGYRLLSAIRGLKCSIDCILTFNSMFNRVTRYSIHTLSQVPDEARFRISNFERYLPKSLKSNVCCIRTFDEYHEYVYSSYADDELINTDKLIVSVFITKSNTTSLAIIDSINRLSLEYPSNKFLLIDVDVVPRSAYDADVQHFPAALISYGGDLYRKLIQETTCGYPETYSNTLTWSFRSAEDEVKCTLPGLFYEKISNSIMKFHKRYNGKRLSAIKSKAGTHSYTHGIDTDNLNLKRVGWPTE